MFEPIVSFFSNFWEIFTTQELAYMTGLEVVMLTLITLGTLRVLKYSLATAKTGATVIVKTGGSLGKVNQIRASKIVCNHCSRTLDKCVCANNKGVGFGKRISKYKKEQKLLKKLGRTK
jgi:hypothetical protein